MLWYVKLPIPINIPQDEKKYTEYSRAYLDFDILLKLFKILSNILKYPVPYKESQDVSYKSPGTFSHFFLNIKNLLKIFYTWTYCLKI